jgi:alkanesulfonate monooxygenase SsuD/methylene tetrahydromethanopterin reductase-like flavin-dependent oxidoreductase (luciferase family)
MRFGISLVASGLTEGASISSMLRDRIEMVQTAKAAGFSLVSAGQHYAARDQLLPQPMPLLARLAAETPGMHFHTGVLLGPFYNPVVLAEEAATLNAITGNRFRAAIGLGYRESEFAIFGQQRSDRLKRVLELLDTTRRLLRGETVEVRSGFYPLHGVALTPGSVDGPPPRIMIGTGTERGAVRAGRRADGLDVTGYLPPADVAQLVIAYRSSHAEAGADLSPLVTLRREVTIGPSRREALARSRKGWIETLSSYLSQGLETRSLSTLIQDLETQGDSPHLPFIVGDPEECAEQVRWYADAGVDEIVIRFDLQDQPHSATLEAIERFGSDVIPLVSPPDKRRGVVAAS